MKVERVSYDVLTPSAARGILEAIHWKPAIVWVVDRIHVLRPIRFQSFRRNELGFSEADLELLWEALGVMFEHDRSAARGEMATRRLIVFRHETALGCARATDLFARVTALRNHHGSLLAPGDVALDNAPPARRFSDYAITIDKENLPRGVELLELV